MPLLQGTYYITYSEDQMQADVQAFLQDRFKEETHVINKASVVREVSILEIGRRSDLVVYFSDRKVFNIECKLAMNQVVYDQALDHRQWADYSYICIPRTSIVAKHFYSKCLKNGIGILLYDRGMVIESISASWRAVEIEEELRAKMLRRVKSAITAQRSVQGSLF